MKGFALVARGTEDACCVEIASKLGVTAEKYVQYVTFDATDYQSLCEFSYLSQTIKRSGLHIGSFSLKEDGSVDFEALANVDFGPFVTSSQGIAVRILVDSCSSLERSELEAEIGSVIVTQTKAPVNLSSPDVLFVACITDRTLHLGIDFCGFDVSKRDYKLFGHRESLNGAVAFAVVQAAGYTPSKKILDPFCGSGTLPIEAALLATKTAPFFFKKEGFLFNKIPFVKDYSCDMSDEKRTTEVTTAIHAYDMLLASMKATQKNAQIAGVGKKVLCGRGDIDWMDTKFKEHEIDLIITHPPQESSRIEEKKLKGIYRELFYQASYILKKEGKVVVVMRTKDLICEAALAHKFKLESETTIYQGSLLLHVLTFKQ